MLVLSRRQDQQIIFPNLNIKLQVLRVKGKVVSLGIDAPRDIAIVRAEACSSTTPIQESDDRATGMDRHRLRNHLNTINLGLRLFQKQTDAGLDHDAQRTMQRVVDELQRLDGEIATSKERVRKATTETSPPRLLVVEDDDNERELLAGLLRLHGFQVDVAANGAEAFQHLLSHDVPDYVLLDMKMPIGSGPATLQGIRAESRLSHLKVFAVSGTDPTELGVERHAYDGWFPKPLDPERLISRIAEETHAFISV